MYPNKKFLYEKWELFSQNVEILYNERIKEYNNKTYLNAFLQKRKDLDIGNIILKNKYLQTLKSL